MLAIGYSVALRGIEAYLVRVEVVGVPTTDAGIHIVGLADRAIQEAKERVNAAVRSCGFLFPTYKIVVNLAPANIRKEGAGFDVSLALTILAMDQQLEAARLRDIVCCRGTRARWSRQVRRRCASRCYRRKKCRILEAFVASRESTGSCVG